MWSDLWECLNRPPAMPALLRAIQLCVESYTPQGPVSIPPSAGQPIPLTAFRYPSAWRWNDTTCQVVLITGTTSLPEEGSRQWLGWVFATGDGVNPGRINSFHRQVGELYGRSVPGVKTLFVGHSMGGAIAHEAAIAFRRFYPDTEYGAIAFGPPATRVGQAALSVDLDRHVNIVRPADPVPWLPGFIDTDLEGLDQFRIPGRTYTLSDEGYLSEPYQMPISNAATYSTIFATYGIGGHATQEYRGPIAIHVQPADRPPTLTIYKDW